LIELDIDNKSYQEIKDEMLQDIAQLELIITDYQDRLANLNKVAEVLLNLNNVDPENRRLARYDYAKMNLTAAITLEQVEQEVNQCQQEFGKVIDDYEQEVRRLEKFVSTLDNFENVFNHSKIMNHYLGLE
jgi:hypothetical protein